MSGERIVLAFFALKILDRIQSTVIMNSDLGAVMFQFLIWNIAKIFIVYGGTV